MIPDSYEGDSGGPDLDQADRKGKPIDLRIIATYSPCCRILREGDRLPDVMHSGNCPGQHGEEPRRTLYLIDVRVALQFVRQVLDLVTDDV